MGVVRSRSASAVLVALLATVAGAPTVTATVPPGSTAPDTGPDDTAPGASEEGGLTDDASVVPGAPPLTLPLIPVPAGCEPAPMAHVVFLGTVVDRDFRTIRYAVDQVRFGTTAPFAAPGGPDEPREVLDVRYGLDVQYVDDGAQYLVGAEVDPDLGVLVSRVEPKVENFGGDEVIGVAESDVDCPQFDDPALTVHPDGTPLEGSMLQPLFDAKWRIVAAIVTPFAVVCAVVFGLSALRLGVNGLLRGIFRPRRRFS